MGLDLYLKKNKCLSCGHQEILWDGNYTYNVAKMWLDIYPDDKGMVEIEDLPLPDVVEKLNFAIEKLKNNEEFFESLNPPNNYGSYKTFLEWIEELRIVTIDAIENNIDATWHAWR